jgi:cytochrome c556
MMIRIVLAVSVIAVGVSTVVADIITDRQALMKKSAAQAKIGAKMKSGAEPFDLVKAKLVFETYIDKADKLQTYFPDRPKADEKTTAAPAIWDKPADWKVAIDKFGADSKAALAATKDQASFGEQLGIVTKHCASCHETFRIKS